MTTPSGWVYGKQCHSPMTGTDTADAPDRARFAGRVLGRPLATFSTENTPVTAAKLQSIHHLTGEAKNNRSHLLCGSHSCRMVSKGVTKAHESGITFIGTAWNRVTEKWHGPLHGVTLERVQAVSRRGLIRNSGLLLRNRDGLRASA